MRKKIFACLALAALFACERNDGPVTGYAPVYGNRDEIMNIELTADKPYESGGKIYVSGHILYQVENGKGIHITDISNPAAPVKKGFIVVRGCQEVAVKDNLVITNNLSDLVVLSLNNEAVTVVKRLPDSFENVFSPHHPPDRGRFECPNPAKGIVIGWEKKTLVNPPCSY